MKFLIATFDHNYYLWQVLVQINNFMKYGYDEDTIYLISSSYPSSVLKSLISHPKIKCKFYIYKDDRYNSIYPVSLRHHILKNFYKDNPHISDDAIFLTDPDMIFTKKLDFTNFLKDDVWYLSDTRSYIGSNYIKNKSEELFNGMCSLVGVLPEDIVNIDSNSGGAQYILKNIDKKFWTKTYEDGEKLYSYMIEKNKYLKNPIQEWTADMWSILWNGVFFKHDIKIDKKLDFCWPVDNIKRWDETYIFHNAGISGDSSTHFSKITYQNSPFNKKLYSNSDNCTYNYIKEIKETEEFFKDIIW